MLRKRKELLDTRVNIIVIIYAQQPGLTVNNDVQIFLALLISVNKAKSRDAPYC